MRLLFIALGLSAFLAACGDDDSHSLSIIDSIPVLFEGLEADQALSATLALPAFDDEPLYAEAKGDFQCASFDLSQSALTIDQLDSPAGATQLTYEVRIAAQDSQDFIRLFLFEGGVGKGETYPLTDQKVSLHPGGLQRLSTIAQSPGGALQVEISATVPSNLPELKLTLDLATTFSTDRDGCP